MWSEMEEERERKAGEVVSWELLLVDIGSTLEIGEGWGKNKTEIAFWSGTKIFYPAFVPDSGPLQVNSQLSSSGEWECLFLLPARWPLNGVAERP